LIIKENIMKNYLVLYMNKKGKIGHRKISANSADFAIAKIKRLVNNYHSCVSVFAI